MNIFSIISMLGGLALFLYGMRIMGDGLKKSSTGSFKKALEKVTNSPFLGFLIGLSLTAIIQSATATIVIVSGLVGAGIMTLNQSIGIILGANVGTTVTGQIIRLLDINADGASWLNFFKPNTLAPIAAIVGVICIMFIKSRSSQSIGTIAMGFGILFTGLLNMTAAVEPLSKSQGFMDLFVKFGNKPLLGFLIGFAVAFILQSSSATIGILQALSITGALTLHSVYPMIIGVYLGDAITTAIVCSIGTKADAKRTGIVNILFNLSEIILISVAVNVIHGTGVLDAIWDIPITSGGIANTHTIFNLSCAILLLPMTKLYANIARKVVKDDPSDAKRSAELLALDDALLASPALAFNSCYKAMCAMTQILKDSFSKSIGLLKEYDPAVFNQIEEDENYLDTLTDNLNAYLSKLTPCITGSVQEGIQAYYLKCITDLERAGDHIYSIAQCAANLDDKGLHFSENAFEELDLIEEILGNTIKEADLAFEKQNQKAAKNIQPYVEIAGVFADECRDGHMERMKAGDCDPVTGSIYLDVLMHLCRVSDMCSNIGIHTLVRHNRGDENYEHTYLSNVRSGQNKDFNDKYEALKLKYLKE